MGESLTLTNSEIKKIREGLNALSGVSNKAGEITRFDFPTDLVWKIAKLESIFERAEETLTKARKAIAAKNKIIDGEKLTPENAPRISAFLAENDILLEQTQELNGILMLNRSELQKAGVNIPSIFTALMPILTE